MSQPDANPRPLNNLVPYLSVSDANAASQFYQKAFAGQEVARMANDAGKLMHCHLYINGSSLMLSDAFPEHGHPLQAPAGYTLTLMVDDIDAWFKRAVDAGCEARMEPQDMFWGDRYGELRDPFGVSWAMNQAKA